MKKVLFILIVLSFSMTVFSYERKPLTYRDWGIYCGPIYHVPKEKQPAGWKYYDPYFIQNDTPWDFFIIQVNTYGKGAEEANKELNKIIDGLHAKGKRAILRVRLFERRNQAKPIEFYQKKLDSLFSIIDVNKIYAVTIDEEMIFWNGYEKVLEPIYDYIKSKHPDLPAFQWYTPMVTPVKNAQSGWRDLRGDGWISDVYCMMGDAFEKHIVKHIALKKKYPVIHTIWASRVWPFDPKANRKTWWHDEGKKQLDFQLKICREYNIPVAFFLAQPRTLKGSIYWAWVANDPLALKEYRRLCALAKEADLIPSSTIGFRIINKEKLLWAESKAEKVSYKFDIDYDEDPKLVITDLLEFNGKKKIEVNSELIHITHSINKGFDLLEQRKRGLQLRGHVGKKNIVELITKIKFLKNPLCFEYKISGRNLKSLGGYVRFSFSKDGEKWINTIKDKEIILKDGRFTSQKINSVDIFGRGQKMEKVWIKCELMNTAGIDTNVSTTINSIELDTTFSKGAFGR